MSDAESEQLKQMIRETHGAVDEIMAEFDALHDDHAELRAEVDEIKQELGNGERADVGAGQATLEAIDASSEPDAHVCEECGATFETRSGLGGHMNAHGGPRDPDPDPWDGHDGLTRSRYGALRALYLTHAETGETKLSSKHPRMCEAYEEHGHEASGLSSALSHLWDTDEADYVTREPSPDDGRRKLYTITQHGADIFNDGSGSDDVDVDGTLEVSVGVEVSAGV